MILVIAYYNCSNPLKVLDERRIRESKIHSGVSLSYWRELGSHGPFKITFHRSPWFNQLREVEYGPQPQLKHPMFEDERELFSPAEISFNDEDVHSVTYMLNAPSPLGPRKLKATVHELKEKFPHLYRERVVNDPYLRIVYNS